MKRTNLHKRAAKNAIFMLTIIAWLLRPLSVWATTSTQEPETETKEENSSEEENTAEENSLQYIVEIEAVSEEAGFYSYAEKPALEELLAEFPAEIFVRLEGEEEFKSLDVIWECEEDYENTESDSYLFYPRWNENLYVIAEDAETTTERPAILVEIAVETAWSMIPDLKQAKAALQELLQEKNVIGVIYLSDKYEVKTEAGAEEETVIAVLSGQSVILKGVALDGEGEVWYQVLLYKDEKEYTGYVERRNFATADEDFRAWAEKYIDLSRVPSFMSTRRSEDVEQFPASYQTALYALKRSHPSWIFVRMDTGLDWSTVILNENADAKNLVSAVSPESWKNGLAEQGWYYASEEILKYYMDPRNFLIDPYIFQFELMNYNDSYHTADAVQGILNNTFMASTIPGDSVNYAQAFVQIGSELKVSPFHLAARVIQEQGVNGTSPLISGTYSGYEGYYNYFNISASGSTNQARYLNGLTKAKSMGWNTRYKSLYGGSEIIGKEYILCGQNTLYLEKFNVANGAHKNFSHQYMQNLQAPYSESKSIRKAYYNADVLESPFIFRIPVYDNMPAAVCTKPDTNDTIALNKTNVDALAVDETEKIIPYVNGSIPDNISSVVSFTSSNTSVATVSGDGTVTAVLPGTAVITCKKGDASASCTVTVVKASPNVEDPALLPVTYRESLMLSDIALPDGWLWTREKTQLVAGTGCYEAIYTPADTTKYNTITKEISVTVSKAIPAYQVPAGLQADYGSQLGQTVLPEGFEWEDDATGKIEKTGTAVYYASYNPNKLNYYTINHIPVMITVIGGVTQDDETDDEVYIPETVSGSADNISDGSSGGTDNGAGLSGSSGGTDNGAGLSGSSGGTDNGAGSSGSSGGMDNGAGSSGSSGGMDNGAGSSGSSGGMDNGTGSSGSSGGTGTVGGSSDSAATSGNGGNNIDATGSADSTSNAGSTSNADSNPASGENSTNNSENTGSSMNNSAGGEDNSAGDTDGVTKVQTTENNRDSAVGLETPQYDRKDDRKAFSGQNNSILSVGDAEKLAEEPLYAKPSVTIEMQDMTILTGEQLQAMKEQNLDLVLSMENQIAWKIDADMVRPETISTIDMGVSLAEHIIPQELIGTLVEDGNYYEITMVHNGDFGFAATLQIPLRSADGGCYANLFEYDSQAQQLDYVTSSMVEESGMVSFAIERAADFLITISEQPMTVVPGISKSSGTLRNWLMGIGCVAIAGAGSGVVLYRRKKLRLPETEEEECGEEDEYEENDDAKDGYEENGGAKDGYEENDDAKDGYEESGDAKDGYEENGDAKDGYKEPDDGYDGYDDSDSYSDMKSKKPVRELSIISPVRSSKKSVAMDDTSAVDYNDEDSKSCTVRGGRTSETAYSDGSDEFDGYDDSDAQEDSENQYEDFSSLKIAFGKEGDWIDDEEWEKMAQ